MKCCILGCKSYSSKSYKAINAITFHLFPTDDCLKDKWVSEINREGWYPNKHTRICSLHFKEEDFLTTMKGLKKIRTGRLPCKQLKAKVVPVSLEKSSNDCVANSSNDCVANEDQNCMNDQENLMSSANASMPRINLSNIIMHKNYIIEKQRNKIRRIQLQNRRLKIKISKNEEVLKNIQEKFESLLKNEDIIAILNKPRT